jgi:hypothetical protein
MLSLGKGKRDGEERRLTRRKKQQWKQVSKEALSGRVMDHCAE